MMRSVYFSNDGKTRLNLAPIDLVAALQDEQGLLWVDFEATAEADDEPILRKTFGFHHLAIEDALQQSHVPKIDDWGSYLYIVLHAAQFNAHLNQDIDTQELDIFIGRNFLVTHHDQPIEAVRRVWEAVQRDDRHLRGGSDHVLYRLADETVASYMPVVEELDLAIDQEEEEIFARPSPHTLETIFRLKRIVLHLRRMIGPQREVLNRLARDDYAVIDAKEQVYFRDIYDHLVRLFDLTETIHDLVSGSLETYLSVVNNRMNEVMKTLTVITTLFMPISFIVGFFGMNFFYPENSVRLVLNERIALVAIIGIIALPVAMFIWMRRRGWM